MIATIKCSLVAALLAGLRATDAEAQTGRRDTLQVRDVLAIREFLDRSQLDLSPDGKRVAFTLRDPAHVERIMRAERARYFTRSGVPINLAGSDILVAHTADSTTRELTRGAGSSWGGTWSPDGRLLAFYSDRDGFARLWLWDRDRNALRRVARDVVRPYWGFQAIHWSPDGRYVLLKLAPLGMTRAQLDALLPSAPTAIGRSKADTASPTASVFSFEPQADSATAPPRLSLNLDSTRSFLNTELADLALVSVRTGVVRRIARHMRIMAYRFSPDGKSVAFTTRQPDNGGVALSYGTYDLFVTDTLAAPRLLVPRLSMEYGLAFAWSPDGRHIAYESHEALNVVAAQGGTPRKLTPNGVSFTHEYRAPLWTSDSTLLTVMRDTVWRVMLSGSTQPLLAGDKRILELAVPADAQRADGSNAVIAVLDTVTKQAGFQTTDFSTRAISGRRLSDMALGATDLLYHLDVSADGRTIAFVAERSNRPPEVHLIRTDLQDERRVTSLHPRVTRLTLGTTRLLTWTGSRGTILRGVLLLPPGHQPGRRHPLVMKVYGGSRLSNRLNRFGLQSGIDNLQLLASRGYAVLLPDAPLRVGTPLADLTDVLPGIDSAIAMGIADSTRLGLIGHSFGGYSTLAILVQTKRFKAAVSSGGFSNLFSQYGEMREDGSAVGIGWTERGQGSMGGSPWEQQARYVDNSPYFRLDRVTTPVLLLHGGDDRTVSAARAAETFVALRRLGKPVTYVRYDGEGHHPGEWSVANATDYWNRVFAWFAKYMAP